MSLELCAQKVKSGDLDRYIACWRAPAEAKAVLWPLYAFNLEVARAPWLTSEVMIAEMRLQWWRDVLEEIGAGGPVRSHEVTEPLADVLDAQGAQDLDRLIGARRWDIYRDPFDDLGAFDVYLEATAGCLDWTAARLLGPAAEEVVRDVSYAAALARWFMAIPVLEASGRRPLPDGRPVAVAALAEKGLARLKNARLRRADISAAAAPALWNAWQSGQILSWVAHNPELVASGDLVARVHSKRWTGAARLLTGRW